MAGKAKTKSTKTTKTTKCNNTNNANNKNILIGICAAVVVVAVVAVAIIFATRKPQLNDSYFVSDNTKYVLTVNSDELEPDEGVKYTPVKTHVVYTYSGDTITGMITYAEFKDEATAKAAFEEYKNTDQEGIKSININGKYVVAEMNEDQYADMTASKVKQYIDFMESLKNMNTDDSIKEDAE